MNTRVPGLRERLLAELARHAFLLLFLAACPALAQNVVENGGSERTAPPVKLTAQDAASLVNHRPDLRAAPTDAEAARIQHKLEVHAAKFLQGWPWRPLHHTLGISGQEVCFDHPDEMFLALSLSLPYLPTPLGEKTRSFLAEQLAKTPPYALEGFDRRSGRPREAYDVPDELCLSGRGRATSLVGLYAFWAYCQYAGNLAAARSHWAAAKQRVEPLLASEYRFDIQGRNHSRDEAETLNGDLAGLIGCARLARMNSDGASEQRIMARLLQLLQLRVNLERVNPRILEKTSSSTKRLHVFKLARFCSLTPEVAEALARMTDGCGAARLRAFREARPAWHLAFGDRLIGGENYTNPLHFRRALFAGAALIEQLPARQVLQFVDVPHSRGDFDFMEQCALALWVAAGRPWAEAN